MPILSSRLLAAVFMSPTILSAATITVDSTADTQVADGVCTLREALMASNTNAPVNGDCAAGQSLPIVDTIAFALPGPGPHVITPAQYLGQINESLTIDGSTQPGFVPNTATPAQGGLNGTITVEISGLNCNGCNYPFGPGLTSGELTLRGIAISHYPTVFAQAVGSSATYRIEGCHLGVAADGITTGGIDAAMSAAAGHLVIGGLQPAQRNLIVAHLFLAGSASITLQGNLIGTDKSGLSALAISGEAMQLRIGAGQTAQIGGSDPAARNVIASASGIGVHLLGFGAEGAGLRVEGNYIGVGVDGVTPLPNGAAGVRWGNSVPADSGWPVIRGNLIAWNLGPGVEIAGTDATVAEVVGNFMHDNVIGIDIDGNGPTPNDADDADSGPNGRMNHPQLRGVTWSSGTYTIEYRVDATVSNAAYPLRVDVYAAASIDDNEGWQWLGSDTIDQANALTWRTISLAGPAGHSLVATTTDARGRTSEFSAADRLFADDFE